MFFLKRGLVLTPVSKLTQQPIRFTGFIRDVYKTIGYEAPFREEEREVILAKLNKLDESELNKYIAKKHSKHIVTHREKNGEFTCVEQLLDVERVETKILERICRGLLKLKDEKSKAGQEKSSLRSMKLYYSKQVTPKVTKLNISPETRILGLRVSLKKASYALIESNQLISWGNIPVFDEVSSQKNYTHQGLFEESRGLASSLPAADFCVQEDMLAILQQDPYIRLKVNLVKLRSYISCELSSSTHFGLQGMFSIKPGLIDKMFELKLGNERISMMDRLPKIIEQPLFEENPFYIDISDENMEVYKEERSAAEPMAGALLQALAFRRIIEIMNQEVS